jgi:streptomycin 6-kinase
MNSDFEPMVDLSGARIRAQRCASEWGLEIGEPFPLSNVSFVAPTSDGNVVKAPWEGDDESLNEGEALERWNGDGAVRLLRRSGRVLLEQRCVPGTDLSGVPEEAALEIAIDLAQRLWKPAIAPFRPVGPDVLTWLDHAEEKGSVLVPLARELLAGINGDADWLVHGDFHHHNILKHGEHYLVIDPKPHLGDREYDVPSFLWNPMSNRMVDPTLTEQRIAAFVDVGLDEYRIRAWTVIRGSYLRTGSEFVAPLRALVE